MSIRQRSRDDAFPWRKKRHPIYPPRFWDNVSKLFLERRALRELDRRNDEAADDSSTEEESKSPSHGTAVGETMGFSGPQERSAVLLRFARHGGPDLTHLRGYRPKGARRKKFRKVKYSGEVSEEIPSRELSTLTTGLHGRCLEQHLIDHNILPPYYKDRKGNEAPVPANLEEIRQAIGRRRPSLSSSRCTNDDFDTFAKVCNQYQPTVHMDKALSIITGRHGLSETYAVDFSNMDDLTDGTILWAYPDEYDGAEPEQLHKQIRADLCGLLYTSRKMVLPIVPNNVVVATGSLLRDQLQAQYSAALGSRAVRSLQTYATKAGGGGDVYDNKAYTLAWIFQNGVLQAFTSHPLPPSPSSPGGRPGYAMTPVDMWLMTKNAASFREGLAAFRNGRDWAKQMRDDAIAQANQRRADAAAASGGAVDDRRLDGRQGRHTGRRGQFTLMTCCRHRLGAALAVWCRYALASPALYRSRR
ncbi:hypothetical protein SPI_03665 [Niveomyces insectorum RCEF 264]|uniref:Uncharacterized protein n=1 Tax=Niveomyces insectorum RCEF 264 TaxID=1081102 RepID=A0A162J4A9_9HYPO|nr:hypothetical protein SPI_03665 [Niveomyces insectorum RCEF 264]